MSKDGKSREDLILACFPGRGEVDNTHLLVGKEIEEYSEGEIVVMESALAKFYAQSFFDFFGRAAILPRRLAPT